MPLFRPESLRSQDRLHGDVNLAPPTAWQAIGFGMSGLLVITIAFLSLAHYAKIATARGVIESDKGVVSITVPAAGIIDKVEVKEGQRVSKGQLLATVRHATTTSGGSLEEMRAQAVKDEAAALEAQEPHLRRAAEARIATLMATASSARTDRVQLNVQMKEQRALIATAEQDLEKVREVAQRGFISTRDVRIREETLATRRQGLSQMMQAQAQAASQEAGALEGVQRERAEIAGTMSEMLGSRASIRSRSAEVSNNPVTTLVATVDGEVAGALLPGQAVSAGSGVMDIVPAGGTLRVRLRIPPEAVAMISPGQEASVAVDAFPYQTYGTLKARISSLTNAAVGEGDARGFRAMADFDRTSIDAYGIPRSMKPGMEVTARIKTMDRSLAQWLLDPIYAVMRR